MRLTPAWRWGKAADLARRLGYCTFIYCCRGVQGGAPDRTVPAVRFGLSWNGALSPWNLSKSRLERLGFPWIPSSETSVINGLCRVVAKNFLGALSIGSVASATAAVALGMRKGGVAHGLKPTVISAFLQAIVGSYSDICWEPESAHVVAAQRAEASWPGLSRPPTRFGAENDLNGAARPTKALRLRRLRPSAHPRRCRGSFPRRLGVDGRVKPGQDGGGLRGDPEESADT